MTCTGGATPAIRQVLLDGTTDDACPLSILRANPLVWSDVFGRLDRDALYRRSVRASDDAYKLVDSRLSSFLDFPAAQDADIDVNMMPFKLFDPEGTLPAFLQPWTQLVSAATQCAVLTLTSLMCTPLFERWTIIADISSPNALRTLGSTSQNTSMKPRTNGCSAEATRSLPASLVVCTPHHSMKAGSGDVGDVCNVCNVCHVCNVCNVCDVCDVGGASSVAFDATGFTFSLRLVVDPMADCSARDSGEPVYTGSVGTAAPFRRSLPEGFQRGVPLWCKAAAVTQKNEPRRGRWKPSPGTCS